MHMPRYLVSDAAHFRRLRSPIAPQVAEHFGPGLRAPLDPAAFASLLDPARQPLDFDPAHVAGSLAEVRPPIFAGASPLALQRPARSGYLLDFAASRGCAGARPCPA